MFLSIHSSVRRIHFMVKALAVVRIWLKVVKCFSAQPRETELSYLVPAECSCHLAKHCLCTLRGQEQGWYRCRLPLASSKHTQQTAVSFCDTGHS